MGQYYMPVIIDGAKPAYLYSHDYGNGLKLMEHSWIRNNFVNAVMAHMTDHPVRLAWLGDYSDSCYEDIRNHDYIESEEQFDELYNSVWRNDSEENGGAVKADDWAFEMDPEKVYLLNMDKKEYVSIPNYIQRVDMESRDSNDNWYVNPLPLLTSVGNGQGGGDYWSDIGADQIGRWAFDRISVTDDPESIPEGFKENVTIFMEG